MSPRLDSTGGSPRRAVSALAAVAAVAALATFLSCGPLGRAPASETGSTGAAQAVLLDGRFDDWSRAPYILLDPADAPGSPVDLGRIQALSTGSYLYLSLETGHAVNAQAMRGSVLVMLDADGDAGSGDTLWEMTGVDLVLELSQQDVPRGDGRGTGIGVRVRGPGGGLEPTIQAGAFDVIVTPTYAADRFELRIARGRRAADGSTLLDGTRTRLALVYTDGDAARDRTEVATVDLAPYDPRSGTRPWSETLAPEDGVARLLSWNVSHTSFRDRPERFAPVLGALEPDVVLLDEVHRDVGEADLRAFFEMPALAARGPWEFVAGTSGGTQMTVVASRIGLRPEAEMAGVYHLADSLDALAAAFPERPAQLELDLERERGIPTVGAWVQVGGHPVLFVPVDLKSAGYDGSWEDRLREVQAARVRQAVARVLERRAGAGSAVIAGDLNLVGSRRPLDVLARGLDGGEDLVPADAYRLADGSLATWRSPTQPFTPGRLDFVLIPERKLQVRRAFTFDAAELAPELRANLGIDAEATRTTSDHLPLVVDLTYRGGDS